MVFVLASYRAVIEGLQKLYPNRVHNWYNKHSISRLFASKILSLSGLDTPNLTLDEYLRFYRECEEISLSGRVR